MKNLKLLLSLTFLIFTFYSCDQQEEIISMPLNDTRIVINKASEIKLMPTTLTKREIDELSCGEKVVDLIAGQHINVGTVKVSNDETNLYVTYETTGDWNLIETHLYVGPENGIPLTGSGNPKIGHFPYHGNGDEPFTIPLTELDECFVIVAHAVVDKVLNGRTVQSETAFGCGDKEFSGNRWGCYFEYCVEECEEECIDAFAYKFPHLDNPDFIWSNCFLDEGFDNWGWSIGPFEYTNRYNKIFFKIDGIEGDNECKPENAPNIGYVEFWINDVASNEVHVNIVIEDSSYTMKKSHVYIGEDKFPLNGVGDPTSDPYYYGNSHENLGGVSSDSYTIEGISTNFYIIVQANICLIDTP